MLSTEKLADLIRQKHQILTQLRDVGHRQMEIVEQGEIASLLKLLAAKQQWIDALQYVERELGPFHAEDPDQRAWPGAEQRAQCAKQAAECNELLSEVVRLEKACEEKMTVRRNEVASRLQHAQAAGHARSAYEANRINRVTT